MVKKSAAQLADQFTRTYESHVLRFQQEGFEQLDAMNLAARAMMVLWARQYVEADQFHEGQLAFRNKTIADLKLQNTRQVKMIEDLGG